MLTMKDILLRLDGLQWSLGNLPRYEIGEKLGQLKTEIEHEIELEEPIKSDVSQTNPKLHELYVNWAMQHLLTINAFIDELDDFSNLNMLDVSAAVGAERAKLIDNNTAYRDAAARLMAGHEPVEPEHIVNQKAPEGDVNVGTVEDDSDLEDGVIHIYLVNDIWSPIKPL